MYDYDQKPKKTRNIIIDWSDVKHKFIGSVQDAKPWHTQPAMGHKLARLAKNPYEKKCSRKTDWGCCDVHWEGGNGADTLQYLREGFHAPEFAHSAEYVEIGEKMRATWHDEEGDPDSGKLLAGDDYFFLHSAKRLSKPGIRIQVEFAFACGCDSKTIQEYGAWVAGFIGSLESSGYDLTVDMWIPLDNLYEGDNGVRTNVLVRVKRENEVSDFTEWSSLFGPTGYRHLGFTAKCVAGDKIGKQARSSLGTTIGGKTWGVKYSVEESLVQVTCNQRAYSKEKCPITKLNADARAAGLIP